MATINGTNGGDSLYGTASADVINGLNGNDTLKGFGGADRLDGGAGIDTAFYGDSSAGVGINLATGRGVGGSAEGDMACTRFRGHRVRCHSGAGGDLWNANA